MVPHHMAVLKKTEHRFMPGEGYYHLGPLPTPPVVSRKGKGDECNPHNAKDGSLHFLLSPGKEVALEFTWVEKEQAWERHGGHRMAFPASYLAMHGWTYQRPHERH